MIMRKESVAVYTTYCGTTQNATFNPKFVSREPYPHFIISNNQEILERAISVGWKALFLDLEISDNPIISASQAKIGKAIPNIFKKIMDFDYIFYKDDKMDVDLSKIPSYIHYMNQTRSSILIRPHPFLTENILYEFSEAMLQARYRAQRDKIIAYMSEEIKNGHKLECQLYATGAILRNTKHPDTEKINRLWYDHILRCGIECQISFDFIAQSFDSINLLPSDLN